MTRVERLERALARAHKAGLDHQVVRVRYGSYRVPSQSEPGVVWPVIADQHQNLHCPCPAGDIYGTCAHIAAVLLRRERVVWVKQRRVQPAATAASASKRVA